MGWLDDRAQLFVLSLILECCILFPLLLHLLHILELLLPQITVVHVLVSRRYEV